MGAFARKRLRERFITFASAVYNVCIRGCKRYPWRTHVFAFKVDQIGPGGCSALQGWLQCTAGTVAVHCGDGCSALRGRLQCTASEMGKTGTEIVSPIPDRRKGRKDSPHMGHCSPQEISAELDKGDGSTESDNTSVSTIMIDMSKHFATTKNAIGDYLRI